jgi:peptidyl-prolyl cis-trans isomerase C
MWRILPVTILTLTFAFAQSEPKAKVNGKPITEAEIEVLTKLAPAEIQPLIAKDPQEILRWYGLMDRLAELAEKQKLTEDAAVRAQLDLARKQSLASALSDRVLAAPVTPEEQEKFYNENKADYTFALVKVIAVPIATAAKSDAAKAQADALAAQLRAGANFDVLAEKYPVDSSFANVIGQSDTKVPELIRRAVFALKTGEVSGPVATPGAVFLFRLQAVDVKPLDESRGDIVHRVSSQRFYEWLAKVRESVVIEPPSE